MQLFAGHVITNDMKMKPVFKKLTRLIAAEAAKHPLSDEVSLYESDFIDAGFSEKDIREYLDDVVIKNLANAEPQVKYAPKTRLGTNPMQARFSSARSGDYDQKVYVLKISRTKLKKFEDLLKPKLWLDVRETREVIINGNHQMAKPNFQSENDIFIQFAFKHPDSTIMKDDIERQTKAKVIKNLHQVIRDLGFWGELQRAFFPSISKDAADFRNHLTETDLHELGIDLDKLDKEVKQLPKVRKK